MTTDTQDYDLEDEGNSSNSKPAASTEKVDYERKFRGQSKTVDRLTRLTAELEAKLDDANGKLAEKESLLRMSAGEKEKAVRDIQAALEAANNEKTTLSKELSGLKSKDATRQKLASKDEWKPLIELVDKGHVKLLSDFEKPEDFEGYVNDMLGWRGTTAPVVPPKPSPVGAVPGIPTSTRTSTETLTEAQIYAEIDKLDARVPGQDKRLLELYAMVENQG